MTVVPVGGVSGDAADLLASVPQSVLPPGAAAVAPPGAAAGAAAHPLAGEDPVELLEEDAGRAVEAVVLPVQPSLSSSSCSSFLLLPTRSPSFAPSLAPSCRLLERRRVLDVRFLCD